MHNQNNLKNNYFFIIDFFLPEKEDVNLKEFIIVNEKSPFNFFDYFIYPVEYKGFFMSRCYILLNREDFLFRDKPEFLKKIQECFVLGIQNIYSLNFKNLEINIEPYIDEFDFGSSYLLLKYELFFNGILFKFMIIIPAEFLNSFIKGLLNEKERKEKKDISGILSYLKLRLYRDSLSSFWDLKNFINELSGKDTQLLLNLLLKNNIVEETMLAGFIAGFNDSRITEKMLNNLSNNIKEDIRKNLSFILTDIRWIQESSYLIRTGIERLLFANKLTISHLNYIQGIKERIKNERYLKIFQEKSYEAYLDEAYKKDVIEKVRLRTERKVILISLKGCDGHVIKYFLNNLSQNAKNEFLDDMAFFHKQESSMENVFKARIKVIESLKDITYEEKADDIMAFKSIMLGLNPLNLNLLIEETGVSNFVQATISQGKDIKKHILNSVKGVVKYLFFDLYTGKVRFKQGFGDTAINRLQKEILKTYYFLKDSGKMI